ncbi:hypothetical protein EMPS_11395 [Entomortierella parvispora]|uniref:3'-5' exonuclease domain-containing protein n=1 Tax=Entomortierella parvispora TaxID=205924 RepID=A0A9P3HLU1_9FUNG|nr:hypothetical protein EMPS_11395 [Entomortierella parvispora]
MNVRHAWNWAKIKADPKKPFFAQRSTKNTPHTAVILLRNAEIPMVQNRPPVFLPETSEQVQHALNVLLFMSDFNIEPRPLAFNVLACSSTGLIHYIQIANQHLSLILPTYKITNNGRNPELIPQLLKTFLSSAAYAKVGFGAYEDAARVQEQYGITCKNLLDTHWMAKIMGIGSSSVGMLHNVFGNIQDDYIPGRLSIGDSDDSDNKNNINTSNNGSTSLLGQVIDPRRMDWESFGDREFSSELTRCIAQDAFVTLTTYDNIVAKKFKPGYRPLLEDPSKSCDSARDFLLTNIPRGTALPVRSIHHLLKGPYMSGNMDAVEREAQALALVKSLVEQQVLIPERGDSAPLTFKEPSILGRRVALPGVRSSEDLFNNQQTKKLVAQAFNCRVDELRLMQDSVMSRKPEKIQDLECFLGLYEWLEFLPGAHLDEGDISLASASNSPMSETSMGCGRKEATLMALYLNFGIIAERAKAEPAETRHWATARIQRLLQQGVLVRSSHEGLVRVNPSLLRQLKRIEPSSNRNNGAREVMDSNKVSVAN